MKSEDPIFDFGFTAVDESELEDVESAEKLNKLYRAIQPLLENLKKNPEKSYILWPDRVAKVKAFEKVIKAIMDE
jgi:hypothetical protein